MIELTTGQYADFMAELEAIEAEKTNKHLEDLKAKMADLVTALRKFTAVGVVENN